MKFRPPAKWADKDRLDLPCGRCVGCRLEKSRHWAMRCVHEARQWSRNVFITLTYDDMHLPEYGTLVKRDLTLFFKRLRKARGCGVRYLACGEYGGLTRRPHYHAIVFNCSFPDMNYYGKSGSGADLFWSKELASLWPMGMNYIGEVSYESAAYVARYSLKKVTGERAAAHYAVVDADGVVFDRTPEFVVMSRRPGVGAGYYARHGQEVRDHDSVVMNCREVRPPRFYDTRTEVVAPERLVEIKRRRRTKALAYIADNTVDRRRVKEIVTLKNLKVRSL